MILTNHEHLMLFEKNSNICVFKFVNNRRINFLRKYKTKRKKTPDGLEMWVKPISHMVGYLDKRNGKYQEEHRIFDAHEVRLLRRVRDRLKAKYNFSYKKNERE